MDERVLVGDCIDGFGNFSAFLIVNGLSVKVSLFSCNNSLDTYAVTHANFLDVPRLLPFIASTLYSYIHFFNLNCC